MPNSAFAAGRLWAERSPHRNAASGQRGAALRGIPSCSAFAFLMILAVTIGCDQGEVEPEPEPPAPPPSPEVRFERLMSELRRRVEGPTGGATDSLSGGGATYTGGYQVLSGEITEPETDSGVHRAVIKIREAASFTVISLPQEEEAEETVEGFEEEPIEGMEDLLPKSPAVESGVAPGTASPIQTRAHTETHDYQLAYVDGRWRLKTDIPPQTFLAGAFRLALDRQ